MYQSDNPLFCIHSMEIASTKQSHPRAFTPGDVSTSGDLSRLCTCNVPISSVFSKHENPYPVKTPPPLPSNDPFSMVNPDYINSISINKNEHKEEICQQY